MVAFLKNETYGYGSQYEKPLVCVSFNNLVRNIA